MYLTTFFEIIFSYISGAVNLVHGLFEPLEGFGVAPIYIITFSGLMGYLIIAIAKWIAS